MGVGVVRIVVLVEIVQVVVLVLVLVLVVVRNGYQFVFLYWAGVPRSPVYYQFSNQVREPLGKSRVFGASQPFA